MANSVLIIDDDTKLRKLLNEYLEENGFQVYSLEDGSEALKTIEEASPDIVILDVMLPGIGGLELLKEINRKFSIPVIMLTAKGKKPTGLSDWSSALTTTSQNPSTPGSCSPG